MDRPNVDTNVVCSKSDEVVVKLLGGEHYEGCTYTHDQIKWLKKLYSEDAPVPGTNDLIAAVELRNVLRFAKIDGQRLMGVLAEYVEPDDDPVKVLIQILIDAGYDVDPENVDWVEEE